MSVHADLWLLPPRGCARKALPSVPEGPKPGKRLTRLLLGTGQGEEGAAAHISPGPHTPRPLDTRKGLPWPLALPSHSDPCS